MLKYMKCMVIKTDSRFQSGDYLWGIIEGEEKERLYLKGVVHAWYEPIFTHIIYSREPFVDVEEISEDQVIAEEIEKSRYDRNIQRKRKFNIIMSELERKDHDYARMKRRVRNLNADNESYEILIAEDFTRLTSAVMKKMKTNRAQIFSLTQQMNQKVLEKMVELDF